MAVKIKLKRLGKMRNPQYRIVVADARTKRDGRAIEEIGKYHPKEEPSLIEVDSERAQYWLGVGAQPTEPVAAILKVTGDWQKFKGLPGAEGTLRVAEPKADKKADLRGRRQGDRRRRRRPATTPRKKAAKRRGPPPRPRHRRRGRTPRPPTPSRRGRRGRCDRGCRGSCRRGCRGTAARRRPPRRLQRPAAAEAAEPRPPSDDRGLMLEEALEHLVRGHRRAPRRRPGPRPRSCGAAGVLEVRVHPDDLGKVIGRGGRTAKALRTVDRRLAPRPAACASTSSTSTSASAEPDAVQVVVGRIGRAHGSAARSPSRCAPTTPNAGSRPAPSLRDRPGRPAR